MSPGPVLSVQNLSVSYPDGSRVLREVSFSVEPGERVGLIGPNGAGKSSLFLSIGGVLAAGGGTIAIEDRDVVSGRFNPAVAMVFQHAEDQLFCPSVFEDVAFGARNRGLTGEALAARVTEALDMVGLRHLADRPVHHLSGGEKRLASIAGALVMDPRLLLCDEPNAGLDIRNRRRLIDLLKKTGQALIVASHDLEFLLDICPRILVLDDGMLVADGPALEILGDRALMEAHGQEVPHSLTPHVRDGHSHRG